MAEVPKLPNRLRICGLDVKVTRTGTDSTDMANYTLNGHAEIFVRRNVDRALAHTFLLEEALKIIAFTGRCDEEYFQALPRAACILRPVFGVWRPNGGRTLPRRLLINGTWFPIERYLCDPRLMHSAGYSDAAKGELMVSRSGNPTCDEETLVHEVLHVAFFGAGHVRHKEEDVHYCSGRLTELLRDNPQWRIPR